VSHRLTTVAGVLVLLLVALELAAVPVATRLMERALSRCVAYESFALTAVSRPVLPPLLVGRAREVELHATGLVAGELRIADARLHLPEAVLPWALGDPGPVGATLRLRVEEPDLEQALRAVTPLGLPVDLELRTDVASVGSAVLPVTLDLEVAVDPDGTVRLRPIRGGELLERFGLAPSFTPREDVRVADLRIADGEVHGVLALDVVPGVGGGGGCEEPIAAADIGTRP
jgi:hypothetical protein